MKFSDLENMTFAEIESYSFQDLENLLAIYDRAQSDIVNKTSKGYINLSDLNRIESNIKTVCDELSISFTQHTWIAGEIPKEADYLRIKTAFDSIASTYNVSIIVPSRPFNTYEKWNDIEYLLYYTDYIYNSNKNEQPYTGEFYAGEYGFM